MVLGILFPQQHEVVGLHIPLQFQRQMIWSFYNVNG